MNMLLGVGIVTIAIVMYVALYNALNAAHFGLVIVLRPQTPKHIRGGWSHYTDTSKPVDCNGAQYMVTLQAGFQPATFRSLWPTNLPTALTGMQLMSQMNRKGPG
jgi:hypothetical protein